MEAHLIQLPDTRAARVRTTLQAISATERKFYLRKWRCLLILLQRITPTIAGPYEMFTHMQHTLTLVKGQQISLSAVVHNEISVWTQLVASLESQLTHLCKLDPFPRPGLAPLKFPAQ